MLRPLSKPGLFITGTDTGVGKTIVAAAIAQTLHQQGVRVGVFKPIASGCDSTDAAGNVLSEDAQLLGAAVGHRFDSRTICPVVYREPAAPHIAARQSKRPPDWRLIQSALDRVMAESDVVIVEGAGGLHVPLDERTSVIDLIRCLDVPAVCTARAGLGTLNHTALSVEALRVRRLECAGIVINRFPREPGLVEQTNIAELPRVCGVPVRCVIPELDLDGFRIPAEILEVVGRVNWQKLMRSARPASA